MKKTNLFSQRGNNLKHKENTNQVHQDGRWYEINEASQDSECY